MIVGQIHLNEKGRFEIDTYELTSGDCVEVLIYDGQDNKTKWIDTRIEYDGERYYLPGLIGYSPIGLFGRIDFDRKK